MLTETLLVFLTIFFFMQMLYFFVRKKLDHPNLEESFQRAKRNSHLI